MILFFNRNISTDILDCLDMIQVLYLRFYFKNIDLPLHRQKELEKFNRTIAKITKNGFLHDTEFITGGVGYSDIEYRKMINKLFDLGMVSLWKFENINYWDRENYCKKLDVQNIRYIMNSLPDLRIKIFETLFEDEEKQFRTIEQTVDLMSPHELNIFKPKTDELFELYIRKGSDYRLMDNQKDTIINRLIERNERKKIQILFDAKCDPNIRDRNGRTPLIFLFDHDKNYHKICGLLPFLLSNNADINAQDEYENTALYLAIFYGFIDIVELLIKNKAEINLPTLKYPCKNVLYHSVNYDKKNIVRLLLDNQADPNFFNMNGVSLVHTSMDSDIEITKMLVSAKADLGTRADIQYFYFLAKKSKKQSHADLFENILRENQKNIETEKKNKIDQIKKLFDNPNIDIMLLKHQVFQLLDRID